MLEKEKEKTLLPLMIPINFSMFNVMPQSTSFNNNMESSASKIEDGGVQSYGTGQSLDRTQASKTISSPKHEEKSTAVRTDPAQAQAKAEPLRYTSDAVKNFFAGQLELTPEFYDSLITAKNRTGSLAGIDVDDIASQIKDKIKFLSDNGKITLSMELKPGSLGTLIMNVSSNKGVISINIFAEQAAKEALEDNIQELKRSLKLANLNLGDLNVYRDNRGKQG